MPKFKSRTTKRSPLSLRLSRHDLHNLELKSSYALQNSAIRGEINLYLFFPSSIPILKWNRDELKQDFYSRMRLAVPQYQSFDDTNSFAKVRDCISQLKEKSEASTYQKLGALFGELLNRESKFQRTFLQVLLEDQREKSKKLKRDADSNSSAKPLFAVLHKRFEEVENILREIRELGDGKKKTKGAATRNMLEAYLHHCHITFLASVRDATDKAMTSSNYRMDAKVVDNFRAYQRKISEALAWEQAHLKERSKSAKQQQLVEVGSDRLLILSQLKKFFQADMYVDVARKRMSKRFTEPLAAIAAASAGAVSLLVQQIGVKPALISVGSTGIMVAGFGVALYVLRDRLKDQGKNFLREKAALFLPDEEQELVTKTQKLGKIREWFHLTQKDKLRAKIRSLRNRSTLTKAERKTNEQVIHIRRQISLSDIQNEMASNRGLDLQEVLRVNLARFLPYMDDSSKLVPILDGDGEIRHAEFKKSYHFHLCIEAKLNRGVQDTHKTLRTHYRIVLDKSGIQKVERVRR